MSTEQTKLPWLWIILVGIGLEQDRREFRSRMRAVAERLRGGSSAATPEITLAGLDLVIEAFGLSDLGRSHGRHPEKLRIIHRAGLGVKTRAQSWPSLPTPRRPFLL